mmetsp:Transcript_23489/g.32941  ORF Transcript_23489/g.32941 Transcript_23489/m.32941 type:complete len:434 (-) Transcript_23489:254-1555(-)
MWQSKTSMSMSAMTAMMMIMGTSAEGTPTIRNLLPFDVVIEFANRTVSVDYIEVTDIVTNWMNEGFEFALQPYADDYAPFDSVILDYQERRSRHLLSQDEDEVLQLPLVEENEQIYDFLWHDKEGLYEIDSMYDDNNRDLQNRDFFTASYKGVSVWNDVGDKTLPGDEFVYSLELSILANREDELLEALQNVTDARGLGPNVVEVNTKLSEAEESSKDNSDLNIIIIIAIVIAAMAFILLATALYMAWSKKKEREAAYAVGTDRTAGMAMSTKKDTTPTNKKNQPEKKKSLGRFLGGNKKQEQAAPVNYEETPKRKNYEDSDIAPSEIGGGLYADSLISEDISTSLTAYYRSGFDNSVSNKKDGKDRNVKRTASGSANDNASISSMESYGYSLDGYQSSIAPSTSGYQNDLYQPKGNNDSSVDASDKESAFSM